MIPYVFGSAGEVHPTTWNVPQRSFHKISWCELVDWAVSTSFDTKRRPLKLHVYI